MSRRPTLRLVQLPIPQSAALAPTGNVPLAAGALAVAADQHGLSARVNLETTPAHVTERLGDTLLADALARDEPELIGFSLYLWNAERSLHLMREVKRRSPRTRILIGGPEVSADNTFLMHATGYDLAVTGEAEDTFATLLSALIEGRDADARMTPGVAVRGPLGLGPFTPGQSANFPLSAYPSPYLAGRLAVDPERSTYVETVRGCRSHCTFCFYPRSSNVLRALDVDASGALVRALGERGAREVVFLDPTFNHRPNFEALLGALQQANEDRRMSFFAEVRAEGLTAEHARAMAEAGFTKLEIGLQSVSRKTLTKTRRGGSPEKVAAAARLLHDVGIRLLVDLIIGLPGDTYDDVMRGIDFLEAHGLGDEAQVFPLAVLPGTAMRAEAEADGLVFDAAPPYLIERTADMSAEEIRRAFEAAESRLDRRLSESPRPHLVADPADAAAPDVLRVDLDRDDEAACKRIAGAPAARHTALWFEGRDLFEGRARIAHALEARIARDPHSLLDVVLVPRGPTPLDTVDFVHEVLARAPKAYGSRLLAFRGEDAHRRVSVLATTGSGLSGEELRALATVAPVFEDVTLAQALRRAEDPADDGRIGVRVVDEGARADAHWKSLARSADPERVLFADREAEAAWVREALGFREVEE